MSWDRLEELERREYGTRHSALEDLAGPRSEARDLERELGRLEMGDDVDD